MGRTATPMRGVGLALGVFLALASVLGAGRAAAGARSRSGALVPLLVRPPGAPWLLGNTLPNPPRVTWSGPGLVEVDAPEDLTEAVLGRAPGGITQPHLLYRDGLSRDAGTIWVLIYVENALPSVPLRITLAIAPVGHTAGVVRWGTNGGAATSPASHPLPAGEASVAGMFAGPGSGAVGTKNARVLPGARAVRSWTVTAGSVLSVWQPVSVTDLSGTGRAFGLSVWEGPVSWRALPLRGVVLSPRPTDVVRATVPHAVGTVDLPVPGSAAMLWDLDNDSPTPGGQAGGTLCPPWVCLNGEVRTFGAGGYGRGSDPLPGEYEAGTDPIDAPGHAPADAVMVKGRLIRTGNYGDYGSLLRVVLRAPPGRVVYAAVLPGFTRAVPWLGRTLSGGKTVHWRLPAAFPPIGWGYEVVQGSRLAVLESTVTPGAYAPWRLAVWSEPAG